MSFDIGIDIGSIIFVFPTAHMRCWKCGTRSSTLLDGLIGTTGPLLVTIVFFCFLACGDWIISLKFYRAFRFVVEIFSLVRRGWVLVLGLVYGP